MRYVQEIFVEEVKIITALPRSLATRFKEYITLRNTFLTYTYQTAGCANYSLSTIRVTSAREFSKLQPVKEGVVRVP